MEINYLAILVVGVFHMILGSIWYGPLFGKKWGEIIGMDLQNMAPERKKELQKSMWQLYVLNFILCLVTLYVLSHFIQGWNTATGLVTALWIWVGFVMPIQAGNAMWSGKPKKLAWMMFLLTAGYQLVAFIAAGLILGAWM